MKEYNFSNCDKKLQNGRLVFYEDIIAKEEIKFDKTTILNGQLKSRFEVTANYSLIILGDINVKNLTIKKDLICFGKLECNRLTVNGNLTVLSDIKILDSVYVGENAIINSGYISSLRIKKDLTVLDMLEIEKENNVLGKIVNEDNLYGEGCTFLKKNDLNKNEENKDLNINKVRDDLNKDSNYMLDKVEKNMNLEEFVKDLESYKYVKNKELLTYIIKQLIPSLDKFENDISSIKQLFEKLKRFDITFEKDFKAICVLENLLEDDKIVNLDDYIRYIDIFQECEEHMLGINLFKYVINRTLQNKKRDISKMNLEKIKTNKDFSEVMYLLEKNKNFFNDKEYKLILDKLYSKIGVKLNLVNEYISFDNI